MQDYSGYGQPPYGGYGATSPLPPMPPRPPRSRIGLLSYVAVALVAGALGAGSVVALYHPASSNSSNASPLPTSSGVVPQPLPTGAIPQPSDVAPSSNASVPGVVSKVEPGLVIINTALQYSSEQAAGTGMVIKSDGLVLTNNHVIEDSTRISATVVSTGRTYQAQVVGYDVTGDIALIKLEGASGLHTVPIGSSATLKTGQTVIAMGNAEGQSMIIPATGTITALNQTITASNQGGSVSSETLHGMIETNADVVSGDSGGPLSNTSGQVIGMDTAGNSVRFQSQSVAGFAIPINTALAIARQINAGQASSTITIGYPPFMGIYIAQGSDSSPQGQENEQAQGDGYGGGGGFGGGGFGGGSRQWQLGLLHQRRRRPPRAIEHRTGQRGHPDPRGHLRRPGDRRGHHRGVGHHRGQRAGHRRTRQPDQRRVEVSPPAPRSRSPGSTPPASAPRAASASPRARRSKGPAVTR